jgi:hypothetical protein
MKDDVHLRRLKIPSAPLVNVKQGNYGMTLQRSSLNGTLTCADFQH